MPITVIEQGQGAEYGSSDPADHAPEAAQHAAPGVEEAHLAGFDQQAHGKDHHGGDERAGDRLPERFDRVGEGEVGAGAAGGAVDTALAASRAARPRTAPTSTSALRPIGTIVRQCRP